MSVKENLIRTRGVSKAKLTVFSKYIDSLSIKEALTNEELESLLKRLERANSLLNEFDDIQIQIELETTDLEKEYEERGKFENSFFDEIAKANVILKRYGKLKETSDFVSELDAQSCSLNGSGSNEAAGILNSIKLPTIELPRFDGDYKHWLEYKDTFSSLIHNNSTICDMQKYHYLKSTLEGTAAQVIKSIELSSKNYPIAWETLCGRFDNNRLLIHNHVKALFDIEVIHKESSSKIRQLLDTINKNLRSLEQLDQPVEQWDTLVIYMIALKLDNPTLREWERFKANTKLPTLDDLKGFLKSRADLLETLETKNLDKNRCQKQQISSKSFLSNKVTCTVCKKEHYIYSCPEFLKLGVEERCSRAKELKLCINCLRTGHFYRQCKLGTCKKCNSKHHTLLHIDQTKSNQEKVELEADKGTAPAEVSSFNACIMSNHVFLATAYIHILDDSNKVWTVRALLDSGSQSSFISESLFKQLNLKGHKTNLCVTGLNHTRSEISSYCSGVIQSMHNAYNTSVKLFVIPEITSGLLPEISVNVKGLKIPPNITLADPTFFKPGKIDILIGADIFWQLICVGQKSLGPNNPVLQKTKFGWVVSGQFDSNINKTISCNLVQTYDGIQDQLKRFWEIEECTVTSLLSEEETACEKHFVKNTEREISGKFIVSIPLKESPSSLGESYTQACRRFLSLEKKLQRDPDLKESYTQFINEYLTLGHMSKVDKPNETEFSYYMPHHCVIKNDSLTTKLRVVFDASAPTSSGLSLNNIQMKGPIIQEDLFSILLRFRKYEIVIAADIEKMYRQVLIKPEQRCLQRIIWRSDTNDELVIFNLNTVTYGTTAASFLAERCVKQLALEYENDFPEAANSIKTDFYVDDWLSGATTIEHAKQICSEVTKILESGGFRLRKFYSNEPKVFENMQTDDSSMAVLNFEQNENTKTLGLVWAPCADELMYKTSVDSDSKVTKRSVLCVISQVFDPLGLLSPCIIIGKILIQNLWLEKLSWDESLPQNLHTQWMEFKKELPLINDLKIQRKVICPNPIIVELHGFSDASEKAYGACVYMRTVQLDGTVYSYLLCAKSKVAPLKVITIPRLELCAALLLSKLVHKIRQSLKCNINSYVLWTDSTIVLHWLKIAPNCLKPFVGNRVSEITELTSSCVWKYVPSPDNPADVVSRGVLPSKIISLDLWWHGPPWIRKTEEFWPKIKLKDKVDVPEVRNRTKLFLNAEIANNSFPFDRFSKLNRLKRVSAYMYRFKHNVLNKNDKVTGVLTLHEIDNALKNLIKIAQCQVFSQEIDCLKQNEQIKPNSKLKGLNPFLDNEGIMRVGGRIRNSDFAYDKVHPIILPKDHHLSKLVFKAEHERLLHAGPSLLLASVREVFWPIGGRNLARRTVHDCITCFKHNAKTVQPIMGDLPKERVGLTVPFNVTGVDYAGPFILKDRKGRGSKTFKGYISLFICFSIKAVHLELVTDLTKESFLLALKRFVSRRGKPSKIFSDNGTNFVATNNELKQLGQFLIDQSSNLIESCANENIEWEFIPPHSPHFGGLWEAGVKSVKHHLRRVIGNNVCTYEEFYSIIVQIEAILNSRPLCPLSAEPDDMSPLTPAHFLVGKPLTSLPEEDSDGIPENRMSRYQHLQSLRRHFWERWSKEFISELQTRHKWKESKEHLQPNTLVLIKDDRLPPLKWRLGRIVSLCPGSDGVNRVAVLKTQNGEIKRSFAKICPLPNSI